MLYVPQHSIAIDTVLVSMCKHEGLYTEIGSILNCWAGMDMAHHEDSYQRLQWAQLHYSAEKHNIDNHGHRKQQSATFYSVIIPCSLRPEAAGAAVTAQAAE